MDSNNSAGQQPNLAAPIPVAQSKATSSLFIKIISVFILLIATLFVVYDTYFLLRYIPESGLLALFPIIPEANTFKEIAMQSLITDVIIWMVSFIIWIIWIVKSIKLLRKIYQGSKKAFVKLLLISIFSIVIGCLYLLAFGRGIT